MIYTLPLIFFFLFLFTIWLIIIHLLISWGVCLLQQLIMMMMMLFSCFLLFSLFIKSMPISAYACLNACPHGQTNHSLHHHSIQVDNAEPEHDDVESEKRYAEEAWGVIFAHWRHNVDASPHFSQNLVTTLFSRVDNGHLLHLLMLLLVLRSNLACWVCRWSTLNHIRGKLPLLLLLPWRTTADAPTTWHRFLIAGHLAIVADLSALDLLFAIERNFSWIISSVSLSYRGVTATFSTLVFLLVLMVAAASLLTNFPLDLICTRKTCRCRDKIGNGEHEVDDDSSNILIDILWEHACTKQHEVDDHKNFFQIRVVLQEKLAQGQTGEHCSARFIVKLVELWEQIIESLVMRVNLLAKMATHQTRNRLFYRSSHLLHRRGNWLIFVTHASALIRRTKAKRIVLRIGKLVEICCRRSFPLFTPLILWSICLSWVSIEIRIG